VYGSLTREFEEPQPLVPDRAKLGRVAADRRDLKTYGTTFFTERSPLAPRSPYSASKAGADLLVLAYADTYRLPVNITRCSNNYGPYHYPEKLIPLMIRHVLAGKPLPVYGTGKHVRDWLYVEDHAKAVDLVLHRGTPGEVYNVGGLNEEENIRVVRMIIDIIARIMREEPAYWAVLKTDPDRLDYSLITHVQDRLGHDLRYAIDPTKIATELGWYPETPFAVGLERTIRWYLDNQDWVAEVCGAE
jgi:dTDP-glucose 4,6-dehydratase